MFKEILLAISVINIEGKMPGHFFLRGQTIHFALDPGRGPMTVHQLLQFLLFLGQTRAQHQWRLSQRPVEGRLREVAGCVELSVVKILTFWGGLNPLICLLMQGLQHSPLILSHQVNSLDLFPQQLPLVEI